MLTFRRFRWWAIFAWIVILGLLFLTLRQTPLDQIWELLSQVKVEWILGLMAVNAGIILLMALRWGMILKAMGSPVSLRTLAAYRLAGFGISYFTPGPQFGGEPLQVHLLHDKQFVPLSTAVSSVFLDRLVDQLANFTFLVVGAFTILLSGVAGSGLGNSAWIPIVGLLLFPLCHLLALGIGKLPISGLLKIFGRRLRVPKYLRVVLLICQAEEQISAFMRLKPWSFFRVIGLAGFTWLVILFEFWLSLRILGISPNLAQSVSSLTAARLAFLLPLPAGLGVLEASQSIATRLLGWGPAVGIALSLLIRARDVSLAALGLWLGGYAYRTTFFGRLPSDERSE